MIIIDSMKFSNIMSYGEDVEINFTGSKVSQLVGMNGAGKSSIGVILEECLYNKNSKGIPKSELPWRYGDKKSYSINVKFTAGEDRFEVDKNVTSTAKVKLYKNGEDISGHTATQTYKLIEQIIGTDFNTFTKLINQSLASSLNFLSATDTNRKKFLIELIGLEKYAEVEGVAKADLKEAKTELTKVEANTSYIETEVKKAEIAASKEKVSVHSVEDYTDELTDLMMGIKSIEANKKDLTLANNKVRVRNQLLDKYKKAIQYPPNKPDSLEKLDTSAIEQTIGDIASEMRSLKSEIVKLNSIKTECFTCKRPFDEVPDMSEEISLKRNRISELEGDEKAARNELANCKQFNLEIDQWNTFNMETSKLLRELDGDTQEQELHSLESLEKELKELNAKIESLKLEDSKQREAYRKATEHNATIDVALGRLQELKEELSIKEKHREDCAAKVNDLTILKDTFSNKGLVAYKIESSIKIFEQLINDYLAELSKGQFTLSFEVSEAKLEVVLHDNGHKINIKSVSSGELNKINTSTLLAVRKLMSAVSKVNINLLFIDEVSSVLDGPSRDELTDLLLNEAHLNSLMVTHEYAHPLTRKIRVIKENRVSRIEYDN